MKLTDKLRVGAKLVACKYLRVKSPLFVTLLTTNLCDIECDFCDIPKREKYQPSIDTLKNCIDEFKEVGVERLALVGGEPLVRDDIGEIISYAKGIGLYTILTSNGYQAYRRIDELKELDLLAISLDGPKEIHDKYRREGSYDNALKSIKAARDVGLKVWTITVLTKDNVDQVDHMINLARDYDFHTLFQPVSNCAYNYQFVQKDLDDLLPAPEELHKAARKIIKHKKEGANVASSVSGLEMLTKWPKEYDLVCYAGRTQCVVETDGKVYACLGLKQDENALNAFETGFKKAFDAIPLFECGGCWISAYIENNLISDLDIPTIMSLVKKI